MRLLPLWEQRISGGIGKRRKLAEIYGLFFGKSCLSPATELSPV
ncbi:hypothetical protein NBRC3257_1638 [Gluconobacter thailandicus NBRC 3257]|uniref:Uncharacterized protein n=1 Tax=Gluconobacter thailandicus NBRC 3257 TaxID=1381097 RepID=A0ABQ0IWR7_GLUTH|nr:hypothetical protein B932_0847 [Gluconobacter oxydans H24]GAC87969.1 hypothetical protein NBRC3255_1630 [Gluconobacter thailandicus NBRC 3255]GAD26639.1 hypothetical protein NBRC3257_1638 [Gluconobacter thailandicus NBRC 3257]